MDIGTLQTESETWGRTNAPDSTVETTWKHLKEELLELNEAMELYLADMEAAQYDDDAYNRVQTNRAVVADELADLIIMAAQLANKTYINLDDATWWKWQAVKSRVYRKEADGVYRHLKGEQQ